ncbi:hypothetical protein NCU08262 [Neurospora crassa OR74A]|uniref:Uncharacterized protein n=1 Tax=Neurospora crassa (strain ATCC 24698 / 74-OR23-1A / CBS 708.71 / DSM 1257 / FGSC 987) TaxID=367110 RepID=Q7S3I1_NEUCR|nr:hypothetical protein NCU08262 [Neurospora crassa OR74A]EAA30116.1 hypothetical protein NCU08262 [Neurospora crassa OR74A]|eukprot:XP_959352.1 hypothetical protein NCU08262 [Neurospora crassa OR74A]
MGNSNVSKPSGGGFYASTDENNSIYPNVWGQINNPENGNNGAFVHPSMAPFGHVPVRFVSMSALTNNGQGDVSPFTNTNLINNSTPHPFTAPAGNIPPVPGASGVTNHGQSHLRPAASLSPSSRLESKLSMPTARWLLVLSTHSNMFTPRSQPAKRVQLLSLHRSAKYARHPLRHRAPPSALSTSRTNLLRSAKPQYLKGIAEGTTHAQNASLRVWSARAFALNAWLPAGPLGPEGRPILRLLAESGPRAGSASRTTRVARTRSKLAVFWKRVKSRKQKEGNWQQ